MSINYITNDNFDVDLSLWLPNGASVAERVADGYATGVHAAHLTFDGATAYPEFRTDEVVSGLPASGLHTGYASGYLKGSGTLRIAARWTVNGFAGNRFAQSAPITLTASFVRYTVSVPTLVSDTIDNLTFLIVNNNDTGASSSADVSLALPRLEVDSAGSPYTRIRNNFELRPY
jgi:hypothetical protein